MHIACTVMSLVCMFLSGAAIEAGSIGGGVSLAITSATFIINSVTFKILRSKS